jgi:hypothetical protein
MCGESTAKAVARGGIKMTRKDGRHATVADMLDALASDPPEMARELYDHIMDSGVAAVSPFARIRRRREPVLGRVRDRRPLVHRRDAHGPHRVLAR